MRESMHMHKSTPSKAYLVALVLAADICLRRREPTKGRLEVVHGALEREQLVIAQQLVVGEVPAPPRIMIRFIVACE